MKINNQYRIMNMMVIMIILLSFDMMWILFLIIKNWGMVWLWTAVAFFTLLLLRFSLIRAFTVEISEYFVTIKSHHPLQTDNNTQTLELPVTAILEGKVEKVGVWFYLKLVSRKKRRYRYFFYSLDMITTQQVAQLEIALDSLMNTKIKCHETRLSQDIHRYDRRSMSR